MNIISLIPWLSAMASTVPYTTYEHQETVGERNARLEDIMYSIVTEAQELVPENMVEDLAIAEYELTKGESGAWDPIIHAGGIHPEPTFHQDHGKAKCIAQLHSSPKLIPKPIWRMLPGTSIEATRRCVNFSMRILVGSMKMCGVWKFGFTEYSVSVGLAQYASGHSCKPTALSKQRARNFAITKNKRIMFLNELKKQEVNRTEVVSNGN